MRIQGRIWRVCLGSMATGLGLIGGCGSHEPVGQEVAVQSRPAVSEASASTQPGRKYMVAPLVLPKPRAVETPTVAVLATAQPVPPAPAATAGAAVMVDLAFPSYRPTVVLEGRGRTVGSDSMDILVNHWWELFKKNHPALTTLHEGKGTGTAVPALLDGASDFGPMSRKLNDSELKQFESRKGYRLTLLPVAVDALAVYVHKDNPIAGSGLTFAQLDAVFSSTRLVGYPTDVTTWGQLGVGGELGQTPIVVVSRNKTSGTYGFFRETVLKKGAFKETNQEKVGSMEVVATIEKTAGAIGFSGIAYKTPGVATVPLAAREGQPFVNADAQHAYAGDYPLARYLYIAVDIAPGKMTDLQREFIRFIYSREGQGLVAKEGYYPITAPIAREQLKAVGLEPGF